MPPRVSTTSVTALSSTPSIRSRTWQFAATRGAGSQIDSSVAGRGATRRVPSWPITRPRRLAAGRFRLNAATMAELEARRTEQCGGPAVHVLDRRRPGAAGALGRWWARARARAGIDPNRLHDVRHWSATMAIGAGADVRTVAGRLGHANPVMTLRVYAHVLDAAD
jgi:integrase